MIVMLIDDHVLFRQGLRLLLSDLEEGLICTEAGSLKDALEHPELKAAELILLDYYLPDSNDSKALQELTRVCSCPVIIVSGEDDPHIVRGAIESGASGFVPKSSDKAVLHAALHLILAGGIYLPPAVIRARKDLEPTIADELTTRQRQVLLAAIRGQPNKVIARDHDIAEGTVKAHLSQAFAKLGVSNRTEAVFVCAKLGFTL